MISPIRTFTLLILLILSVSSLQGQEMFLMKENKQTRWVSFENRSGMKGQGGQENKGAKGHAFDHIKAGEAVDLVNMKGSGTVRRMWLTFNDRSPEMLRALKVEMFWEGSAKPAVSVPIGDFFGVGLGKRLPFESALFSDPEGRSFNCFIPMPFKQSARITLTNESDNDLGAIFYDVDLLMEEHDEEMLYFHAYWSRSAKTELEKDFEILPKVKGKGRFLGTNIGVKTNPMYEETWWGEGEVKMYIDNDSDFPSLVGSGTEDYIGTAYGQGTYSHQYQGSPVANAETGEFAFYRYHIPDPVYFYEDIKVAIQQIGGAMKDKVKELMENGAVLKPISIDSDKGFVKLLEKKEPIDLKDSGLPEGWTNFYRQDDVSATAYFYLDKASSNLPALANLKDRIIRPSTKDK